MRKKEIDRKLEEIIDFSGVERYIDTPVKRYSSGMYVRLAFAVAAHLESEILIVDEVLAVGDAEFQKKCLGKMGEVSKGEGRTVLFVSHNMAAVQSLCEKAILLNHGMVEKTDDIFNVIANYQNDTKRINKVSKSKNDINNENFISFFEINVLTLNSLSEIEIKIEFEIGNLVEGLSFDIALINSNNQRISTIRELFIDYFKKNERISLSLKIDVSNLISDLYHFNIALHIPGQILFDSLQEVGQFEYLNPYSKLWENNMGLVVPKYKIN
jgi:lipopolysaccharide transport system ATP-binding protein